jgi:hypothetical protein
MIQGNFTRRCPGYALTRGTPVPVLGLLDSYMSWPAYTSYRHTCKTKRTREGRKHLGAQKRESKYTEKTIKLDLSHNESLYRQKIVRESSQELYYDDFPRAHES